jgi:hypothetical protein
MQGLFGASARRREQEPGSPRAQQAALAAARVGATSPTPSAELERVFAASFGRRSVGSSGQGASPGGSSASGSPGAAGALGLEGLLGALQQLERQLRQGSPSLLQALGEGLESGGAEELQQRLASAQRCSSASTGITRALQGACSGIRRALAAQQRAGGERADAEGAAAAEALQPQSSCESSLGLPFSEEPQSPLQVGALRAPPHPCWTACQAPPLLWPLGPLPAAGPLLPCPLPRAQVFSPADAAFLASSLTPLAPSRGAAAAGESSDGDGLTTPVHRVRLPSGSPATLHQNALFNGQGPSPDKGQPRQPGAMAASVQVSGPA